MKHIDVPFLCKFQRDLYWVLGPTVLIPWNCEVLCCVCFACDFYSVNFLVVIVDASVLYLIKYFTLFAEDLDLMEIVIEDSEVFYLFLLAKKVK